MELDEFSIRWCVERLRDESDKQLKFMRGFGEVVQPIDINQVYVLRESLRNSAAMISLLERDLDSATQKKNNKKFKFFRRK